MLAAFDGNSESNEVFIQELVSRGDASEKHIKKLTWPLKLQDMVRGIWQSDQVFRGDGGDF
jgi:hypothetical protein